MTDREYQLERAGQSGALVADGYDEAIIGTAYEDATSTWRVVYSESAIVDILMQRDGMDRVDAEEYFDANIGGSYMGPGTPIFVDLFEPEP